MPLNDDMIDDGSEGAAVLDAVYDFLGRFIAYPHEQAHVAHVLWIAHCHLIEAFDTTPRLAFLSAEPASGKTRSLEISELLVPLPIEAVNMSPAALFRLVARGDGMLPAILHDEIDTVFGPKAKDHEDVRGLINAGHRRGAKTYRCVMNGKKVEVEAIEAFCPVALAGLGWLPDTILSRSLIIRMKRRAPNEIVEPYRRRDHVGEGHSLRDRLEVWADGVLDAVKNDRPDLPPGIEDRDADKWEPLIAVADAAGGEWPRRTRAAAVVLVRETQEMEPSLGLLLLQHLRVIFGDADALATDTILHRLHALDEAPWDDLRNKPLNARGLATRLRQYDVKSKTIRIGQETAKGYTRADLSDAWRRNIGPDRSGPLPTSGNASQASHPSQPSKHAGLRVTDPEGCDGSKVTCDFSGGQKSPIKWALLRMLRM